jgi:hypothetical protein
MSTSLAQVQREDLRFAVRAVLVNAKTVALSAPMIESRIERYRMLDFAITLADVEDALALVVSLGHAVSVPTPLGATLYYQATGAGVLAHERGA